MVYQTTDSIAWDTWNDDGRVSSRSAKHAIDPEDYDKTLCGRWIPTQGDGIEVGSGQDYGTGKLCKRCKAALDKMDMDIDAHGTEDPDF